MPQPESFADALATFHSQMDVLLLGKAEAKGYSGGDCNGGRDMIDAVVTVCGESHPPGEIIYKIKRYLAKRDPEDVVKIAAWAFLIWDRQRREKKST